MISLKNIEDSKPAIKTVIDKKSKPDS
jgi:hypothetical protein